MSRNNQRRWRVAATVAAAVLVGAGIAAPTAHAEETDHEITAGSLDWGVKKSFRDYVTGPIGGGQITLLDGASLNEDGSFRFSGATGQYTAANDDVTVEFDGGVQFQAHGHDGDWALDLTISNLAVDTDNASDAGVLTADVVSKDMSSGEFIEFADVVLADLDLTGAEHVVSSDAVSIYDVVPLLSADGAVAFGGFYEVGSALDSLALTGSFTGEDQSDSGDVNDGSLDWGVKKSFRDYVTGPIANGSIEVSDGAQEIDGVFRFVDATGTYADGAADVAFTGTVRFLGHEHNGEYGMDLSFTNISLTFSGNTGSLIVDGVVIADVSDSEGFEVTNSVATLGNAEVTLTADGAEYFGGFYAVGSELDPLTVNLAVGSDATLPGVTPGDDSDNSQGRPSLAKTGSSLTVLFALAGVLMLVGVGTLIAIRRNRSNMSAAA